MPFTPFHLGPGILLKAAGGKRFSFMVFGGSQVLMDVEPLIRMIRHEPIIHGASHSILGALVIGAVSGFIGRPISEFALRLIRVENWSITWAVSFVSAFIGTFSHIIFDAIMHRDMSPFWPLASGNPLLNTAFVGWLHIACAAAGVLGITMLLARGKS
jgi:membrane-bound metal-dependent hydrolase YbcI (DUF457 family)